MKTKANEKQTAPDVCWGIARQLVMTGGMDCKFGKVRSFSQIGDVNEGAGCEFSAEIMTKESNEIQVDDEITFSFFNHGGRNFVCKSSVSYQNKDVKIFDVSGIAWNEAWIKHVQSPAFTASPVAT